MPIKSIYFNNIGKAGVNPQIIFIETDDTYAQVTAPGFLNKAVAEGEPISDNQMALVTIKTSPNARTTSTKFFNVVHQNGMWSLGTSIGGIKFFGQKITPGGAAVESFSIPGLLPTDLAFTQMVNNLPNGASIVEVNCLTNFMQVNFSADPGNGAAFNYQILRGA